MIKVIVLCCEIMLFAAFCFPLKGNSDPGKQAKEAKASAAEKNPAYLSLSFLCNPANWKYDGKYISVTKQDKYVRGNSKDGLLFSYTRSSKDLEMDTGELNSKAYRPVAEVIFPDKMDWSKYNRFSAWVYLEGNTEEILSVSFEGNTAKTLTFRRDKWTHLLWDYAYEPTKNLKSIKKLKIWGVNQGSPPGDPQRANFYLSDFKLEKVDYGHFKGWKPDPEEIILAYTGFRPDESIKAVLAAEHAGKEFTLNKKGFKRRGRVSGVKSSSLTDYCVIELEPLEETGKYQIQVADGPSVTLYASWNPYDNLILKALPALNAQRCGTKTVLHGACHLDDGRDGDEHVACSGGWHDEGVFQKPITSVRMSGSMAKLRRFLERRSSGCSPEIIKALDDEIAWGVKYILKYSRTPGKYFEFVQTSWYYTDNIIGNADDRKIKTAFFNQNMFWKYLRALAVCAQITKDKTLRQKLTELAETAWSVSRNISGLFPPNSRKFWNFLDKRLRTTAFHIEADVEMYRLTKDKRYLEDAVQKADYLLTLQQKKPECKDGFYGYFYYDSSRGSVYNGQRNGFKNNREVPGRALASLLEIAPEHKNADKWREALRLYAAGTLKKLAKVNSPYAYIASGPYLKPITIYRLGQEMNGMIVYNFHFSPRNKRKNSERLQVFISHVLEMSSHCAAIGRVLRDKELLDIAEGNLRYLFGENPFHFSIMRDFGDKCIQDAIFPNLNGYMLNQLGMTVDGQPFYLPHGYTKRKKAPVFFTREGRTVVITELFEAISEIEKAKEALKTVSKK